MVSKCKIVLLCATILTSFAVSGMQATTRAASTLAIVGKSEDSRPVTFDVVLPLRDTDKLDALLEQLHDPASSEYHHWLTPAEFGNRFGPDKATIAKTAAALRTRGFTVAEQTRSLRVSGTAKLVSTHFGTTLMIAQSTPGTSHIVASKVVKMPDELAAAGAEIFSFSPHVAHPLSRVVTGKLSPANRSSPTGTYWFDDLKEAYSYPSATATATVRGKTVPLNGTGVTIAALMSSDALDSDVKALFDHEKWKAISGTPDPKITHLYVNGGAPSNSGGAFDEASLDVQEEITGAPGAHVVLVDIPDLSDGSIFAGYVDIIESNSIDLVSSSFGGCELGYFPKYNDGQDYRGVLKAMHELFLQGNAQGITFLASSGDEAGLECPNVAYFTGDGAAKFVPSVSTPASDPNVTAVGGTNVVTAYLQGTLDSQYVGENAWGDPEIPYDIYGFGTNVSGGWWGAGGGFSQMWPRPNYQTLVKTTSTTARALPDIGMQVGGCPAGIAIVNPTPPYCTGGGVAVDGHGNSQRSAVVVAIGGSFYGLIGTSVSSPELAGAVAGLIEQKGRMGNLNTYIYKLAAKQAAGGPTYYHTNIPGYNGHVLTDLNSTYSLSTGVGTPIVSKFIEQKGNDVAGTPQTASNP